MYKVRQNRTEIMLVMKKRTTWLNWSDMMKFIFHYYMCTKKLLIMLNLQHVNRMFDFNPSRERGSSVGRARDCW